MLSCLVALNIKHFSFGKTLAMKHFPKLLFSFSILLMAACSSTKNTTSSNTDDGKIDIVFLQINDVYEIAPVAGGKEGGMARVATLKKQYYQKNRNTFLVMAGDFVSPSVYNSLKYNDKKIRGAQMIDCMNAAGMDFAIFGNHEFDITEAELQDRINESGFNWISTNTFHKTKNGVVPFERNSNGNKEPFQGRKIVNIHDADGTTAKIGLIGLTMNANKADYVSYADPFATAKLEYDALKDSVDVIIAITHQSEADDIELAKQLPGLAAILGGHEHSGIYDKQGNTIITKAQSNARTAYVVNLHINKKKRTAKADATSVNLNENVAIDSNTNLVVQQWKKIAEHNYASIGFDPKKELPYSGSPLDGRETETRNHPTNLTKLITTSMAYACPKADVVIFNSGSIRLDDILTPPITQYDIIRSLPFGGGIREADMKGSLLLQVLQAGLKNRNSGGFLQFSPVIYDDAATSFLLNNKPIDSAAVYRVAVTEFLFSGKETNLLFLNEKNPGVLKVYPAETAVSDGRSDVRLAVMRYLEKK